MTGTRAATRPVDDALNVTGTWAATRPVDDALNVTGTRAATRPADDAIVVTHARAARIASVRARPAAPLYELAFPAMGTRVRLLASDPRPLRAAREEVERLAARLTRFDPASELCALNANPRDTVPASPDLRAAMRAALAGARLTGGLADPTLLSELERAGYATSLAGRPRAAVGPALASAPARRPAAPHPAGRWRDVTVDDRAGTITRPRGVRLDLGGSAKGFIADRAAALLLAAGPCAADCGGDMRIHGEHPVHVRHPLSGDAAALLDLDGGAVATSGIDARLWRTGEAAAHHLIDPASGRPAWTGVLAATALAPTAAEAEARAKAALLAGPDAGREILRRHGGVLIRDDGSVATVAAAPAVGRRRDAAAPTLAPAAGGSRDAAAPAMGRSRDAVAPAMEPAAGRWQEAAAPAVGHRRLMIRRGGSGPNRRWVAA